MRKLILAPMALACLIGSAVAQQAPTSTADQGKPGAAPWPVSWTGQSVLADLRVAGNLVAAGNPVPISGSITANIGTSNGLALDTSVQAVRTALGSPFQAGGSIGNTAFGISGTLPPFASTPTVNLGTLSGAATATNQATANSSLASIVTNTTGASTAANQASEIAALQALSNRASYGYDYQANLAAGATLVGQAYTAGTQILSASGRGQSAYTRFVLFINPSQAGTGYLEGSNDNATWAVVQSVSLTSGTNVTLSSPIFYPYYRGRVLNGSSAAPGTLMQGSLSVN